MEDQLLGMAEAAPRMTCCGWRLSEVQHWLDGLDQFALYELGFGGKVHGRDFYNAKIKHARGGESWEHFVLDHPDRMSACEEAARKLQEKFGGLYVGMRDSVRSIMCERDGGSALHNGMCPACNALNFNQTFMERIQQRLASDGDGPSNETRNNSVMTSAELRAKLDQRAADVKREHRNAHRRSLTTEARLSAAEERGTLAASEAKQLLRECMRLAEGASAAERAAADAKVALAIESQQRAVEQEAAASKLASTEASLRSLALSHALVEETLEDERCARAHAECEATAAQEGGKRKAAALEQSWCKAARLAAIEAAAVHEREISALHTVHAKSSAALRHEHQVALEAMQRQSAAEAVRLEVQLDAMHTNATADAAQLLAVEAQLRDCERQVAELQIAQQDEVKRMEAVRHSAVAAAERTHNARRTAECAVEDAEYAALPALVRNLMTAHKLGNLDKHSECVDILTDLSMCLVNGSSRGRSLSHASKVFYGLLLNNASPWAHKFVSGVFFGPDIRTSQRARAAFDSGLVGLELTEESLRPLKEIHLKRYGLETVPGLVSEDATTSVRRLDAELVEQLVAQTPSEVWTAGVKLWGFSGGTHTIKSAEELQKLVKTETLAAYVYIYVWIPILPSAPWFPFAIVATDNKFDHEWVFQRWRIIHRSCERYSLPIAGHVSDGDARLRKKDYHINFATNACNQSWYKSHYFLNHPLLMLSVPETIEGHAIFGHQDYMHLAWRLRVQLLSPKKEWEIGPGLRVGVAHLDSLRNADGSKMLNGKDLDPHNKQHWSGVVKMFSGKVSDELKRRNDAGEAHLKATYAIIVVFSAYLDSWLRDRDDERDPLDAVEEAALVLAFVMHWRYHVVTTPGLTLAENFLTRETFLDLVTSCHGCILRFPQFRDNWGGKFRPDGTQLLHLKQCLVIH